MKYLLPPGRSLNFYASVSWIIPAITAIGVSIFAFIATTAFEYRSAQSIATTSLLEKSKTVARRISAELLIGPRGAVRAVSTALERDLNLTSLEVNDQPPACITSGSDTCTDSSGGLLIAYRRIPFVTEPRFVAVSAPSPRFGNYFKISNLIWSTLPIAFMLGIGLFFQRLILRRYFLSPVRALVETSTGDRDPRPHWPKELKEISEHLYRSFGERDEAIFSQIARGVIHDLRTLIHAPLTATELSIESRGQDAKRLSRLENLERVCEQQLPKMRDIIDTTLDGSRDIPIRQNLESLRPALEGTQKTLEPLLNQTKTKLTVTAPPSDVILAHDSVQLERALTNLLKNGIEACSSEQERRLVSLSVRAIGDEIAIDVEDSGPGLRLQADRIFRPLKSTKPHGSGLGLVVSRKIIEAHGGRLVAGKSTSLSGAKMSIILSLTKEVR